MYLFLRKHRNIKFILILLVSSFPSLFCESAVLSYFSDVVYTMTWTIIFFTTKMMLWWSTASNADQISTYHRASTKKWVWPNMTKLMDNNSSCSVSTVLEKKSFFKTKMAYQPSWWEIATMVKLLLTSTTTWPANRVLLAKMLLLPILQSWAIWHEPITRLLSPITCKTDPSKSDRWRKHRENYCNQTRNLNTVQSQDLEERWMEQYSLISFFLPICRKHSSPV